MPKESDHQLQLFWSVFESRHGLRQAPAAKPPLPGLVAADGTPEPTLPHEKPEDE